MKINRELMKGSTSILILTLLEKEDMYGYRITQELKNRSNNIFDMKEGTLYPTLHSLEKDGAVESYWLESEEERKRKYYRITDTGTKLLRQKQKEWHFFMSTMNNIIGEKCYE